MSILGPKHEIEVSYFSNTYLNMIIQMEPECD